MDLVLLLWIGKNVSDAIKQLQKLLKQVLVQWLMLTGFVVINTFKSRIKFTRRISR